MADNKKNNTQAKVIEGAVLAQSNAPPIVTIDYERYAHHLEGADLTEAQKQEFLETLWSIICEFVSLGFGVHPLQQVQNTCGQLNNSSFDIPSKTADPVYLDEKFLTDSFKTIANHKGGPDTKGDS